MEQKAPHLKGKFMKNINILKKTSLLYHLKGRF